MRTNKIIVSLLLYATIAFPQYTPAASFCTTSPEGKVHMDDCSYGTYDECKRAIGSQGDCIADSEEQLPSSGVAPYCIVTWSTECKYYNYDACAKAAKAQMGFCYLNPAYKKPE